MGDMADYYRDWIEEGAEDAYLARGGRSMTLFRREFHVHPLSDPKKMHSFLSQGKYWVDATLAKRPLKEMETDHLLSTMLWLIKRAGAVKFTFEMHYRVKGADAEKLEELANMTAEHFIRNTVLFQSLERRYLKRIKNEEEMILPFHMDDREDDPIEDEVYS